MGRKGRQGFGMKRKVKVEEQRISRLRIVAMRKSSLGFFFRKEIIKEIRNFSEEKRSHFALL